MVVKNLLLRKTVESGQRFLASKAGSIGIPELERIFPDVKTYEELYKFSINKPDKFWGNVARERLRWTKDFDNVLQYNPEEAKIQWFEGGELNVSVQCLDRHVESCPDATALIWEKDEPGQHEKISYQQLSHLTCKIANVLKSVGVKRGDRVAIYLPVSPTAVASMLACARIGVVHTVVFAGFSADALASRINDAGAVAVITSDNAVRGGKTIELKKTVDRALEKCPTVKKVLVARRTGKEVSMKYPRDICLDENVFDSRKGDVFGCLADIGWITGHSYVVYGPLANGVTSVLFESMPTYPDPGRYWEAVERLQINQLYCAPTALRLLIKHGNKWVKKYDRSSLRTLGSVGEPINHEAWDWYHRVVGEERCDLVDTWWQTETGGICMSPRPSSPGAPIKPAMCMRPMLGIEPVLFDASGLPTKAQEPGALCIKTPWPGMARTIYGDHKRFRDTYFSTFPGYYFTGDGAGRDSDGYYYITGRLDDVINVTGHRLGTAEVEDALDEHQSVAESAVVGYPHPLKGEAVYAYVVLREDSEINEDVIVNDLKKLVKKKIAGYAVPDIIQICGNLPKTRSGKIMRRILRKIAADQIEDIGDTSTLADPSVVEAIVRNKPKTSKAA